MHPISPAAAETITSAALDRRCQLKLAPLTIAVLDPGGHLVLLKREDGSGILRADVAIAKAWGPLAMGWPAAELTRRAEVAGQFFAALTTLSGGRLVPAAGGVPVSDGERSVVGSVGISGDTSQNDEMCAVYGIRQAGLTPWLS